MEAKYGEQWSVYHSPAIGGTVVVGISSCEVKARIAACSGLDMNQVPTGAVRELVEAARSAKTIAETVNHGKITLEDIAGILNAALAPFVGGKGE